MKKCFSDVSPEDIHSVVTMLMCILLLAMTPKALNTIQLTVEFGINPTHVSLAGDGTAASYGLEMSLDIYSAAIIKPSISQKCLLSTNSFVHTRHQKDVVRVNRVAGSIIEEE